MTEPPTSLIARLQKYPHQLAAFRSLEYRPGTERGPATQQAGMTPYVAKPLTSGAKAEGQFDKKDFIYVAEDNTTTLERTSAFG
jgi:hypothetical protein